MTDPIEPLDLIKQVDDRAECEWLLEHLPARDAKLLWDRYALGIPLRVLARREGVSMARIGQLNARAMRRLEGPVAVEKHRRHQCDMMRLYTADE